MIIVIDGPAGSGKSSTAKAVAQMADLKYLDSGALYRAVTLHFLRGGFSKNDNQQAFFDSLESLKLRFDYIEGKFRVWLNDDEISEEIRTLEVSQSVSVVAAMPTVRDYVNVYLREVVKNGSFIADGRDLSTVVFPDAELKVFMVASIQARAQRRFEELQAMGKPADLQSITDNIAERDHIDSSRETAPLKKHESAVEIDTSNLTFDEQVQQIVELIENKGLKSNKH
ncbi:(d)CMP kinase [bacterium]|nr:MAG: (d)CMP kinase [bacterium]